MHEPVYIGIADLPTEAVDQRFISDRPPPGPGPYLVSDGVHQAEATYEIVAGTGMWLIEGPPIVNPWSVKGWRPL